MHEELKKLLKERRRNIGLPEILDLALDLRQDGKSSIVHSARGASPASGYDSNFAEKQQSQRRSKGKQAEVLSPWEGLSANRRSCLKCGYCEAIRYEVMGALDVAVPMSVSLPSVPSVFTVVNLPDFLALAPGSSTARGLPQTLDCHRSHRRRALRRLYAASHHSMVSK